MANFNKVLLLGNLVADPVGRTVTGGLNVASFTLAVDRQSVSMRGEVRNETCFVDIEIWGRQADVVMQYCKRGRPLFVEGRLRYDQWDDRETGRKRSRLIVTGENVQLVGSPDGGGAGNYQPQGGGYQAQGSYQPQGGGYQAQGGYQPQAAPAPAPASMPEFQPLTDDTPESPF